jgi:GNAT superfamily N-acetyltransferase
MKECRTRAKKPRQAKAALQLRIEPVTPDRWPALEELFGERGACNGCWCMYWRIGAAYRRRPGEENRNDFRQIVKAGPPPGLVAFDGDLAVGWCQITPRDSLPWLDRTWRLRRVDDLPVWAISCFYVRIGYRRRGITSALIRGAVELARRAGAPAVEAYPLDGGVSPSATSTGYRSTFAREGFKEIARRAPERPIMRYELAEKSPQPSLEARS